MEVVEGWDAAGAGAADGAGTILVDEPARAETGGVVLYARVSSSDERDDLERQVGRLAAWATQQGLGVTGTVAEAGSGLNGSRAKLKRLRADPAVGTVVVEHRERLARFGVEYVEAALRAQGRRLVVVVVDCDLDDDLVRDITEALTSSAPGCTSAGRPVAARSVRCSGERGGLTMLVTQAFRFALDPTPAQERKLRSHAGAARFAYNFGLAQVKTRLDRRARGDDAEVPWTLPGLRREWNQAKARVAPWWAENSKQAASSGLADLAAGLGAFWDSKHGRRAGPRVGFPRFKRRGRARESFRYSTGRFGVSGRTHVQLPRIGHVRTHEPTTKLGRKLQSGAARVRSMAVSRDGDRWYCSLCCEVERVDPRPASSVAVVGVDAGVHHLAVLSTGERRLEPARAGARAASFAPLSAQARAATPRKQPGML